jgi:hypothetical protein
MPWSIENRKEEAMEMWCLGSEWSRNTYVPATEDRDYCVLRVLEEAQAEVSIVRTSDWAES